MSRFALDVLGSAVLGRAFGAIDGTFDDTYRSAPQPMQVSVNLFGSPLLGRSCGSPFVWEGDTWGVDFC